MLTTVYEGGGDIPTHFISALNLSYSLKLTFCDLVIYTCVISLAVEFISFQMFHFGSESVQRRLICAHIKANPFFPFCY